jgi:hypothetical protein
MVRKLKGGVYRDTSIAGSGKYYLTDGQGCFTIYFDSADGARRFFRDYKKSGTNEIVDCRFCRQGSKARIFGSHLSVTSDIQEFHFCLRIKARISFFYSKDTKVVELRKENSEALDDINVYLNGKLVAEIFEDHLLREVLSDSQAVRYKKGERFIAVDFPSLKLAAFRTF